MLTAERKYKVDKEAAHRFVTHAIPRAQRLPATSAAAQAQKEADDAVGRDRLSQRFKYIADEKETERFAPDPGDTSQDASDVEALMREVEEEIKRGPTVIDTHANTNTNA